MYIHFLVPSWHSTEFLKNISKYLKSERSRYIVIQHHNPLEKGKENSSSKAQMKRSNSWNPEWHNKGGKCCSPKDFSGIDDLRQVI